MIKCKHCKAEIDKVFVVSEYTQIGDLKGNTIVAYSNDTLDNSVGITLRIECFECNGDVTKQVNEVK